MSDPLGVGRALEAAYDRAWAVGDVGALLACLAPDVVLVSPRGDLARGHAAVRAVFEGLFAGWAAGTVHTSTVLRVEPVTDDVLLLDGLARVSGVEPGVAGADAAGEVEHAYTEVLVRRDGRWLIGHVRAHAPAPGGAPGRDTGAR